MNKFVNVKYSNIRGIKCHINSILSINNIWLLNFYLIFKIQSIYYWINKTLVRKCYKINQAQLNAIDENSDLRGL